MRQTYLIFIVMVLGCVKSPDNTAALRTRLDSLEEEVANAYKPGFGEFMSSVQAHHAKLWFAGENRNWKLADFEIHEMMEAIDAIQKYETEREESKMITMINPALDSVNSAVDRHDPVLFRNAYAFLTNTCNNCHRTTNFEFNVVKIPDSSSFRNQDFKAESQ